MRSHHHAKALILHTGIFITLAIGAARVHADPPVTTWVGTNANWNNAANWTTTPPGGIPKSGDSLIFDGSSNTTNTNNINGLTLTGISFAPTASSFTLNGNAVNMGVAKVAV